MLQRSYQRLAHSHIFALAVGVGLIANGAIAGAADSQILSIELNKLEPFGGGCRAYVVITNASEASFQSMKFDLVLFQPDKVISRRLSVDFAPLMAAKKTVKVFDIPGTSCDKIASVFVNDVTECSGSVAMDCFAKTTFSSKAVASMTK